MNAPINNFCGGLMHNPCEISLDQKQLSTVASLAFSHKSDVISADGMPRNGKSTEEQ